MDAHAHEGVPAMGCQDFALAIFLYEDDVASVHSHLAPGELELFLETVLAQLKMGDFHDLGEL